MRWFEGEIASAIAKSKSKNAIFVVYVEGKDENSKQLTSFINDESISRALERDNFTAVKLEADSVSHRQFKAIYPNVKVPSLFFIGKSGVALDIIEKVNDTCELAGRIEKVISAHTGNPVQITQSAVASAVAASNALIQNEQIAQVPDEVKNDPNIVCENGVCHRVTNDALPSETKPEESTVIPSVDEPIKSIPVDEPIKSIPKDEPAKSVPVDKPVNSIPVDEPAKSIPVDEPVKSIPADEPIKASPESEPIKSIPVDEVKPETSLQPEEEITAEADSQEISKEEKIRRAKELIDKKRAVKQAEEEESAKLKEIERRKMGQDVQKLHRWQQDQELKTIMEERLRAKNEEKAARDRILAQIQQDKAERASRFNPPPTQNTVTGNPRASLNNAPTNSARLQFRLPSGVNDTNDFESTATLQEVHNYIHANITLPFRHYTLSTTFPRREFTQEHNTKTMQELELCPNAVILILPSRVTTVTPTNNGGIIAMIWTLLTPFIAIFGYVRSFIFGSPPVDPIQSEQNKRASGDSSESDPPQPPTKRKMTTVVRRQGNIHRLKDRTDSDDENNTWNGNSTQQM